MNAAAATGLVVLVLSACTSGPGADRPEGGAAGAAPAERVPAGRVPAGRVPAEGVAAEGEAFARALRQRMTPPSLPSFSLPTELLDAPRDRRLQDVLAVQPGLYQGIAVLEARCDEAGADRSGDQGRSLTGAAKVDDGTRRINVGGDGTGTYDAPGLHVAVLPDGAGVFDDGTVRLSVQAGGAGTWTAGDRRLTVRGDGSGSYEDAEVRVWLGEGAAGGFDDGTTRVSVDAAGKVSSDGDPVAVQGALAVIADRLPPFAPVPVITRVATEGVRCGTVIRLDANVLFDLDRSDVRPESDEILARVATLLTELGSPRVRIDGHTDAQGSAEYNQGLSTERAVSVQQRLTGLGVPSSSLEVRGHGETRPLRPETGPEGQVDEAAQRLNRRVELVLLDPSAPSG